MAHTHDVFDTDKYFSIDENTRVITFEGDGIPVIAQGDRNSERFTFELPRYIDGHDMTKCNVAQVHFVNINASDPTERISDIYNIDDLQVDIEDEELALCTWLINANATRHVGSLNFALRFACINGSVEEYSWSTVPYTKIAIASTIDNTEDAASNLNYTLDEDNPIVELEGYYSGTVQIDVFNPPPITPSSSTQIVRAEKGKVLGTVTVNPIPGNSGSSAVNYRLSGTWSFNTSKLLYNIPYIPEKTISATVAYSNGVPGSENDSVNYTSMTFDCTARTLKFDDMIAFYVELGVWSNGDYGTKVTFDGVQYVSEEFYNLFASVADYISGTDEVPAALQDNRDYYLTVTDDITVVIGPEADFDAMKRVTVHITVPTSGGSTSTALKIDSFTNNVNTAEIGQTIPSVVLSWTLSKEAASVTLDGVAQSTSRVGSSTLTDINLTSDKSWTLTVTDSSGYTETKTTSIAVLNGVYYGASTAPDTINSEFILGLTKELRSSKLTSINVTAEAGEYIYYCIPTSFGTCRFSVDGFTGGFALIDTISFTNASGYSEDYYVYRSDYAGLGATSVIIS